LDWQTRFAPDPQLLAQYEADLLPLLSVSKVRTLLRTARPLPELSPETATTLVLEHLVNPAFARTPARKLNIVELLTIDRQSGQVIIQQEEIERV
jgi:hypothetical protein